MLVHILREGFYKIYLKLKINVSEMRRAFINGYSMDTVNIEHTSYRTRINKAQKHNTTQKTQKRTNKDLTINQVLTKGKQFLPLIRQSLC